MIKCNLLNGKPCVLSVFGVIFWFANSLVKYGKSRTEVEADKYSKLLKRVVTIGDMLCKQVPPSHVQGISSA